MKNILKTLIIFLCFTLLFKAIFINPNTIKEIERVNAKRFWSHKVHSLEKANILILGSSQIYRGIAPHILTKENQNLTAINLGFSSGGLNQEIYRFAESKLRKNDTRIIILGINPYVLLDHTEENKAYRRILQQPFSEVFENIYLKPFLMYFTPYSVVELFKSKQNQPIHKRLSSNYYDSGWAASNSNLINLNRGINNSKKTYSKEKLSNRLFEHLISQITEWENNNIKVFTFRPPTTKAVRDIENHLGGFNQEYVASRISSTGATWISIDNYESYNTYDGVHLLEESAIRLSNIISKEINAHKVTGNL